MRHASVRSLFALAALVLYLLPSVLGTVARMAHDAEHALESQLGAEGRAVPRGFVHSHGGDTHAHGPGVEALALAAAGLEGAEEDDAVLEVPPVLLLAQLPPAQAGVPPRGRIQVVAPRAVLAPWAGPSRTPPVPPPNG